jgi:hypothetical protein
MKKCLKNILLFIPILFLPHILEAIQLLLTGKDLCQYQFLDWLIKIIAIFRNNLALYCTFISLYWGFNTFFQQQKDSQDKLAEEKRKYREEIQRKEIENLELRNKELENYRDSFRPTFVIDTEQKKLKLLMKKGNLYITNIHYYKSENDKGIYFECLRHSQQIDLAGADNNFYVTAETLIGEKIIFGLILKSVKVYKALKNEGFSTIPSIFNNNCYEKIENNWISFNLNILKFEPVSETTYRNYLKQIDEIFMFRTINIREKMAFNLIENMKVIINEEKVSDVILSTLLLLENNKQINEQIKENTLNILFSILQENLDKIQINPTKLKSCDWKYVHDKIPVENKYSDDKEYAACYIIQQYANATQNINNRIIVFKFLIEFADFSKDIDTKIIEYKEIILRCIEN